MRVPSSDRCSTGWLGALTRRGGFYTSSIGGENEDVVGGEAPREPTNEDETLKRDGREGAGRPACECESGERAASARGGDESSGCVLMLGPR